LILGQKYWKKAQKLIPGGTMLFSKNPDLFLPKKWPAYFSKAKGCALWDLENKKYSDLCLMGVGTNTLGYANNEIDNEVIKKIRQSNMSSLNNIEEIMLAEKLIELHPWSEMVRFARSGGEANSIAIRIARAATNKKKIALCGYHGWHDWYLSGNLTNPDNLKNFLFSDVPIKGVPKDLKNTVYPFEYNNFEQLESIVSKNDIGIVKMEVSRNYLPKNDFLEKIRRLCNKKKIILIFDECTSGFRKTFGGLHKLFNVNPDMAIFGKALGNGYAINAIIGKRSVMESAKSSFISSTFWTERIGSVAGLKTLEVMNKYKSWEIISKTGDSIKNNWLKLSNAHNIKINIMGVSSLPNFNFAYEDNLFFKTYISQEMLKYKILAGNSIYVCIDHNKNILEKYYSILDLIFKKIKDCINERENIRSLLKGPVCIAGIRNETKKNK
jgi:glutamate-1-semialdehyde aminotransferase